MPFHLKWKINLVQFDLENDEWTDESLSGELSPQSSILDPTVLSEPNGDEDIPE